MPRQFNEIPADELRRTIDAETLSFDDTSTLEAPEERILGQARASSAIAFGVGMRQSGYNIFVAGPPNAGLTHIAQVYLQEQARQDPTPPDWCYVHNFKEPDRPRALQLSAGKGVLLKKDMNEFVRGFGERILQVFQSEEYAARKNALKKAFEQQRRDLLDRLGKDARAEGFFLQVSQAGMILIPAHESGRPMTQEEIAELTDAQKESLRQKSESLHDEMKSVVKAIRRAEGQYEAESRHVDGDAARSLLDRLLAALFEKYEEEKAVVDFLHLVEQDIIENLDDFRKKEESASGMPFSMPNKEAALKKYDVNVLVDNTQLEGAPVVFESNPNYPNLFGAIERQAWFGALFTDFSMIKPGVLHKANGGYLILKALDVLRWGISWDALKRALREKEIRIEDVGELMGLFSTQTIRPQPIPLQIKIVLTGDPWLFEILHSYDDRFHKLFKVKAHLDDRMDRQNETAMQCARIMGSFCREQSLRHLDRSGVARVLEYSMELAEDRDKLTLELGNISDILREADYFAAQEDVRLISRCHVERAVEGRIQRASLPEDRMRELFRKEMLLLDTEGGKAGQINGLSILRTGDYEFGKPCRITAVVSVGREGVVAIERESKLSGNLHTKGVLILNGFLQERFAQNKPISLSAALCFEQNYGMIDGDSASSTELFALLSALAQTPIDQGIAVTGSVSQKGEIQAIGGVTRKVESFFEVCRLKGLNGRQGVIIPLTNQRNLMLKREVVEAARRGRFHIWPIQTIEEGIEILTGLPAGKRGPDGTYPRETVFGRADERIRELAEIARRFGKENDPSDTRDSKCQNR